VDKFISVSNAVGLGLIEAGVEKDRIKIIYSSLDINDIKNNSDFWDVPDHIREKCNRLIVSAGALTEEKDFFTAIKAVSDAGKKVSGIGLLILGEGPQRSKLERFIIESKLENIFLMGHIEPMAPIFKKCELFLLTSISEGLNNSAIEAAACGLPLVTSNIGGLPEIAFENENGLLCKPGDYKGFAEAIIKVLSDKDIRNRMGHKSSEISDRFNIVENVQKISDLYKRMLAENN
jgi:glycosyltransferase involved in cell wall biosynthesis